MKHLMKTGLLSFMILLVASCNALAQEMMAAKEMVKDTMTKVKVEKQVFPVRVDFRVYNNTLKSNRTLLAANGFVLDKEAIEIGIKFGYLPKIYYFQQLGTLSVGGNFPSVTGFGLKERLALNLLKPESHFVLMPYVEVGAGYYKMNFYRGVSDNTIQTVAQGQISHDAIDAFTATIDLGLNLGFWFKLANRKITLVANGGFQANTNDQWRIGSALAFKEKLNLASPYVGLNFGISML